MNNLLRNSRQSICWLTIILIAFSFPFCKKKATTISKIDPAFAKYVESYTSGVVSRKNTIRIQLNAEVPTTHVLNETIKEKLFEFSPSVEGKAYWVDSRTIEFKPSKELVPDKMYEVKFHLGKVIDVPEGQKIFTLNFKTIKPSYSLEENGLKAPSGSMDELSLSGVIETADIEDSKSIEKILKITYPGAAPEIKWQHNEAAKTHTFIIEKIKQGKTENTLELSWNGSAANMEEKGQKEIIIPAIGDFKVLSVRAIQEAEEYILVQFSDPIAVNQDLKGLIVVSGQEDLSFNIQGSEIKVYTTEHYEGSYTVNIHQGIANEIGRKLPKAFTANVFFENRLPAVKIHGRGNILPATGGKIVLPFEAVNLKAVDVSIVKIFENNIAQFLQYNHLDGSRDLRRVAQPIVTATVRLDDDMTLNLRRKNRFSLDIDKYLKTEPGAIYRVMIAFRPEYSLFICTDSLRSKNQNDEEDDYYYDDFDNEGGVDEDVEFWNRYDTWYPFGYNWQQRDNPCHNSYYNKNRFAYRNILSTNIGLTAKRGTDNTLMVATTDIISTDALNNVELTVMDYQHQVVGSGKTDNTGIASIAIKRKPFLLVAKRGDEKSYLKLDDGNSLPLSRFDISGAEMQKGLKGFLFGERGVWRPGDSLFLSFIVEDKDRKLPAEHPVEMELYTPKGQLYKRLVQSNASGGFNVFRTNTDAEAPTGNWLAKVKLGGAVFEKKLKIETVMPNRLKINLDFGGEDAALGKGSNAVGTLSARWLFGAIAKNLKAKVDVSLYKSKTGFKGFEGYTFNNPTADFSPQSLTIFDGTLNSEGVAAINPNFDAETQAPGMLTANLFVKVFEPGGNFSIDNQSFPYHPYQRYMGIKVPEGEKPWGFLSTNRSHTFNIVRVDTKGKALAANATAQVELYKIQWRWWWDNSGDNLSNFTQDRYNKLVAKVPVELVNGKGKFTHKFTSGDYGRYLVIVRDPLGGHAAGETFYIEDEYWQRRENMDDPTAASMLSFTADKEKYNAGEKVTLTIPSSKGGRAFISIENGSKVLKTHYVETTQGQTVFQFIADKEMAPNVYANVTLLQPHAQTINDLPIRMYGVIPIHIEDKTTILKPVIKIPDVIKPETPVSLTVSETSGKKMDYVIAIVDEGLLDLTRFKTPDPHKHFFAREALGVKSWDLFDYVIGAWGGELERILTIGGDDEGTGPGKKRANRFAPVVKFMGPFTSSGGSKTHTFTLPSYMGSVRTMVIAAGDGAYGFAEQAVAVKKPLMVLPTVPRVLAPAETIRIPVTVFATESNIKNVRLSLKTNPFLEAAGSAAQMLTFNAPGEKQVYFDARVKNTTGIGTITIEATSGNESSVYNVELDIRNPNPPVTSITEKTLAASEKYTTTVTAIGTAGTNKAVVEISTIPALNLQQRLGYLINYPHGCIEQVTSSVFPQLVLNQIIKLGDNEKLKVERNVKKGIEMIRNFQSGDGGFTYWPGYANCDDWGTNYAGHFLLEAAAKGYNVPSGMMQSWKGYQQKRANAWLQTEPGYYGGDLTQAYRLYLLALAKSPELGAMNRLKEYKFITPEAKWRLAAAYHLAGQQSVALQLISGLPTNFSERQKPGITYGSSLRDQAMVLETFTIMNRRSQADQLVRDIAAKLGKKDWYSTQTTAYALISIAKFTSSNTGANKLMVNGNIGGQSINLNSNDFVAQTEVNFKNGKAEIQLTNKGGNVLFVRIINQGQPVSGDTQLVKNSADKLQMNLSFISSTGATIDPATIKQGTDFVAKVTIKNTGQRGIYNEMALSQIFPSGWEILNTRLYNSEGAYKSSPSEYMDIRDDRVYHYFDIKENETLTYYVQLNAAYLGRFYWPGVYAEAMYDNSISAGVKGKWVEVKE